MKIRNDVMRWSELPVGAAFVHGNKVAIKIGAYSNLYLEQRGGVVVGINDGGGVVTVVDLDITTKIRGE